MDELLYTNDGDPVTGLVIEGQSIPFPPACKFSISEDIETRERRTMDGTCTSRTVKRLRRSTPSNFNASFTIEGSLFGNVMEWVRTYEYTIGKNGTLIYSGYPLADVLTQSVNVNLKVDAIKGIEAAEVSFTMRENVEPTPDNTKIRANVTF